MPTFFNDPHSGNKVFQKPMQAFGLPGLALDNTKGLNDFQDVYKETNNNYGSPLITPFTIISFNRIYNRYIYPKKG